MLLAKNSHTWLYTKINYWPLALAGVTCWDLSRTSSPSFTCSTLKYAHSLEFSPDGRYLLAAGPTSLEIFDLLAGSRVDLALPTPEPMRISRVDSRGASLVAASGIYNVDLIRPAFKRVADGVKHQIMNRYFPNLNLSISHDLNSVDVCSSSTIPYKCSQIDSSLMVTSVDVTRDSQFVILGSRNATVQFISLPRGNPVGLLSVHPTMGWLFAVPDGRFDAPPSLWDDLIISRRTSSLLPLTPQAAFRELYTPSLIQDVLAGSSGRTVTSARALKVARPPRVTIESPEPTLSFESGGRASGTMQIETGGSVKTLPSITAGQDLRTTVAHPKIKTARITTQIRAHDEGGGVVDCRLFLNRVLVSRFDTGPLKAGYRELTSSVTVIDGQNELSSYCFDSSGVRSAIARSTVIGDGSLRANRTAYVFAIGINRYKSQRLQFAKADADLIISTLRQSFLGLGEYSNVVAVELFDEDATREHIEMGLRLLAGDRVSNVPPSLQGLARARPQDSVIFYFAGHGGRLGKSYVLAAQDYNPENVGKPGEIAQGTVSDQQLRSLFYRIDAGRQMIIIDACQSGSALNSEVAVGPYRSSSFAQMAYDKGIFVITATQSDGRARELEQYGHGLFTYVLVNNGLVEGKADYDPPDGIIQAREWLKYAARELPEQKSLAQSQGYRTFILANWFQTEQAPRMFFPDFYYGSDFVISRSRPR